MNKRQEQILEYLTEEYLTSAQPVPSRTLAKKRTLAVSSATIRNEMAKLEEEEFIYQPHTSAGRIPTVKGLEYYIEHLINPIPLTHKEEQRLAYIFKTNGLHGIARFTAEVAKSAVVLAHGNTDFYYTGFSYLFSRPDFNDYSLVCSISFAVDKLESALPYFMEDTASAQPKVYLGKRNPLGTECAAMFISGKKDKQKLFGILGPLRMSYAKNLGILQSVHSYM